MIRNLTLALALLATRAGGAPLTAAEGGDTPRPIPLTRPEMKQYLEDMKTRTPRIPLPELTDEEQANTDERSRGYEGRLRALYMPAGEARGGFGGGFGGSPNNRGAGAATGANNRGAGANNREPDPKLSLDYKFKTMLFWIVSRTNNCQYCMGHQESKLLGAGMSEDEIAALDGDWLEFTPAERSAFALARKLTYEPHRISDADVDRVREHYTDLQILEMVLSMSFNNSINRWKEGVGVPQSAGGGGFGRSQPGAAGGGAAAAAETRPTDHSYLTPTSEPFQKKITQVAPVEFDEKTGAPTHVTVCKRPALESRDEVEAALAAGRERKPRLPLVDEAAARAILPADWSEGSLSQWVLLVANFPVDGLSRIVAQRAADEKGDLSPLLKAQVSWIVARQDRAWYAVGQAKQRLNELGWSDDQIYALDGDWNEYTPAERALFTVARKLAATPVVLTDADVARALKLTGPREVVQLVSYVTTRASFDRITEAAGLTVDR